MAIDLLADQAWWVASTVPGAAETPSALDTMSAVWRPGSVPATAAEILLAGADPPSAPIPDAMLDGMDWWWRTTLRSPQTPGPWRLICDGLATLAEVWLDDEQLATSDNMFRTCIADLDGWQVGSRLAIGFRALSPVLSKRRPRPRWKSQLIANQNLRWQRTTLLGRAPALAPGNAPVGPWRPIRLERLSSEFVLDRWLRASCVGEAGHLDVSIVLRGPVNDARLVVDDQQFVLDLTVAGGNVRASGRCVIAAVERWWPSGYGSQRLYSVRLLVDGTEVSLGRVGFREIAVDRGEGAFTISVNDVEVFCRGAVWTTPDLVRLRSSAEQLRQDLQLLVDTGMTMIRVSGTGVYESPIFYDLCDELGILVWQDLMLAGIDPPDDPTFTESFLIEVSELLIRFQGRPCLAVVCGSSEVEQQAAMFGLPPGSAQLPLLTRDVPDTVSRYLGSVPYVPSSPTGGELPFHVGQGIAQYFGVGAYLRPLSDARRAGVRFAAECLAFSIPPEDVDDPDAAQAGHHPEWKAGVPRDRGTAWDFEDVRDHYVEQLFNVDVRELRYADPQRYLLLGRAAVVELMCGVFAEWRRPGSGCAGGLVLSWRDLRAGSGWGLVDHEGRPKAPLLALADVLAPVAVLVIDEGLDGLHLVAMNDTASDVEGEFAVQLYGMDGSVRERSDISITVPARGAATRSLDALLGFRDVNWAYRFGPAAFDAVAVQLHDQGREVAQTVYLPLGPSRPVQNDIGLAGTVRRNASDNWIVEVTTEALAQRVTISSPGWRPARSWFHLAPGTKRTVELHPVAADCAERQPRIKVGSLNSRHAVLLRPPRCGREHDVANGPTP